MRVTHIVSDFLNLILCLFESQTIIIAQESNADARELVEVIWDKVSEDDVFSDDENITSKPTAISVSRENS